MTIFSRGALLGAALSLGVALPGAVAADNLIISTGLGQPHLWVKYHMNPFADEMTAASDGNITFTRFYAGELSPVGRELDSLNTGVIDVAAPLLAPYHEGRFPLSDVTQLPAYNTSSPMVTRAFQNLLDSDVPIKGDQTFYDYEIGGKGIRAWAIGATAAYSITTSSKKLREPADFDGTLLRAGAALHMMVLENLGATGVTIPAPQIYESLSRGTVDGMIISTADWPAYSIQQLLRHTIMDVSIGHWESYLAVSDAGWAKMSPEEQEAFDRVARDMALRNAEQWEAHDTSVREESIAKDGGEFVSLSTLSDAMRAHIDKAAHDTWIQWVEKTEAAGHPARETARVYAQLLQAEGGVLPDGIADWLQLD